MSGGKPVFSAGEWARSAAEWPQFGNEPVKIELTTAANREGGPKEVVALDECQICFAVVRVDRMLNHEAWHEEMWP